MRNILVQLKCLPVADNSQGYCDLSPCFEKEVLGSLEHMLLDCVALAPSRAGVLDLWDRSLARHPDLLSIVFKFTSGEADNLVQFILDPSPLPEVILARQIIGQEVHDILFYITRTFCYALHKAKMKLLGLI